MITRIPLPPSVEQHHIDLLQTALMSEGTADKVQLSIDRDELIIETVLETPDSLIMIGMLLSARLIQIMGQEIVDNHYKK